MDFILSEQNKPFKQKSKMFIFAFQRKDYLSNGMIDGLDGEYAEM